MNELRDIPGYEGLYAVSEDGRVWSYARAWTSGNNTVRNLPGAWLKPEVTRKGYLRVTLYTVDGKRRFMLHRLVGLAWIPNPNLLPEINHRNGIKADCTKENLEWSTKGDNERHAWRTGLKKDTPARRLIRQRTMRRVNDAGLNRRRNAR